MVAPSTAPVQITLLRFAPERLRGVMAFHIQQQSTKQERFIQIGKRSHRIADDHHALLIALTVHYRYMTMEQLLFWTSFVGARVLHQFNPLALINVYRCGGKTEDD